MKCLKIECNIYTSSWEEVLAVVVSAPVKAGLEVDAAVSGAGDG